MDTGFLQFAGPVGGASLGTVKVIEKNKPAGRATALSAATGQPVAHAILFNRTDDTVPGSEGGVTVDIAGKGSNAAPIPNAVYSATAYAQGRGTAGGNVRNCVEVFSDKIGEIKRNGASVNIAHLTISEQYNQRLIIVNRNARPIVATDIILQTEDGVRAQLTDAAVPGAIGAGESVTYRVRDLISITGNSQTAALQMSFRGVPSRFSVATTQVNLNDSSTDTVIWPVE